MLRADPRGAAIGLRRPCGGTCDGRGHPARDAIGAWRWTNTHPLRKHGVPRRTRPRRPGTESCPTAPPRRRRLGQFESSRGGLSCGPPRYNHSPLPDESDVAERAPGDLVSARSKLTAEPWRRTRLRASRPDCTRQRRRGPRPRASGSSRRPCLRRSRSMRSGCPGRRASSHPRPRSRQLGSRCSLPRRTEDPVPLVPRGLWSPFRRNSSRSAE